MFESSAVLSVHLLQPMQKGNDVEGALHETNSESPPAPAPRRDYALARSITHCTVPGFWRSRSVGTRRITMMMEDQDAKFEIDGLATMTMRYL